MEQQPTKMRGEAVLLKRGDKIPEGAIFLTDSQVVSIQQQRIEKFQPQSEMNAFNYSIYVISGTTAMSGMVIASAMRRNFRLGGLRRALTYFPTVVMSGLFAIAVQEQAVKQPILLGREHCPTCTAVKAGAIQLSLGVAYTYVLSLLTCIPTARDYYTLPHPVDTSNKGRAYFQLLRQVSPKSSWMLGLTLCNMFVGSYVAARQLQVFAKHLSQPPSKIKEFLKENSEMLE